MTEGLWVRTSMRLAGAKEESTSYVKGSRLEVLRKVLRSTCPCRACAERLVTRNRVDVIKEVEGYQQNMFITVEVSESKFVEPMREDSQDQ